MKVLAIDTSTEILSLCCCRDGQCFELSRNIDLRHGEELIPLADWALRQMGLGPRDLELVVAAAGPGSFTGLRVGMAAAKGIAAGAGCALTAVPTLDAWGQSAGDDLVLPLIDAKKKRFYAAFYRNGRRLSEYTDASPEEIAAEADKHAGGRKVILGGPHAALFWERLRDSPAAAFSSRARIDPDAATGKAAVLLRLGLEAHKRGDAGPARLFYIRAPETTLKTALYSRSL